MYCSGCGKDIPFGGDVCPYCQRDKSNDQAYTALGFILGICAGVIGYFIFGFWGAIVGIILGIITALVVTEKGRTQAPEVRIVEKAVDNDKSLDEELV